MRKIREVLRLKAEGLGDRQIATSIGSARSTVQECLSRCCKAGIAWPLPPELTDADARGQVTDATLGNGLRTARSLDQVTGWVDYIQSGPGGGAGVQNLSYLWDRAGNMTQRQDNNQGLTENAYYDNLYRLDYTTLNGSTNLDMVYTANGNLTNRAGTTLTWFASNLPKAITKNSQNSSAFQYTPAGQRWRQAYKTGNVTYTQIYLGSLMEKVTQGSAVDWKHYIFAEGQAVALYSRKSSGVNTLSYLLRDALGSVDAITDSAGAVTVRESFGAFGQRRGTAWSGAPSSGDLATINGITRRGYTGHEMLDSTDLIHMNGRVYDPFIARFVSADPFVDGALNTQGWNRLGYVGNVSGQRTTFWRSLGCAADDASSVFTFHGSSAS